MNSYDFAKSLGPNWSNIHLPQEISQTPVQVTQIHGNNVVNLNFFNVYPKPAPQTNTSSNPQNYSLFAPEPYAIESEGKPPTGKPCVGCQSEWSVKWRTGNSTKKDLCNACGILFVKVIEKGALKEAERNKVKQKMSISNLLN